MMSRRLLVGPIAMAAAGCSASPSRNILGAYFPSWMICALLGITAALLARTLLNASGLLEEIPAPAVALLAFAVVVTLGLWLAWLS